jgi:hypothetical protein
VSIFRFIKGKSAGNFIDCENIYPAILVAHAVYTTEYYENMPVLSKSIDCDRYSWNTYGDLKMIALLVK